MMRVRKNQNRCGKFAHRCAARSATPPTRDPA
jgi:hypothetical protein